MRSLFSSFLFALLLSCPGDHRRSWVPVEMALDSVQLESFSFRWLISIKDDSIDTAASFIDIDPNLVSFRWTLADDDAQGRTLEKLESSHLTTKDAEEYFSDGDFWNELLMNSSSSSPLPSPLISTESLVPGSTKLLLSLSRRHEFPTTPAMDKLSSPERRWRYFLTEVSKYLCFAVPLYKQVKELGKKLTRSQTERCRPRRAAVVAIDDEEHEKSINEAVLHCKKSRTGGA
ncbi:hypothetical protein ZOSMA_38G00560 [Zostera marina]|uniref:Uncharacterized protein n=1 Tax=Zostera marina TaxID=29655 RepID=A0A0K9P4L0_ZOSMR|nr:hypothetical protein ZOSMA_38G00560 [Zostera marina]